MKTYIGYATDDFVRLAATSGGVGTGLLRYLFESRKISTAITLEYDVKSLMYYPKLIYDYKDYKPVGSIYHEINLISFIKENTHAIKGGFACFCLPCQVETIQAILKDKTQCYTLCLTCSSQQTFQATDYLLKRMKINRNTVTSIRYRGNGWPSGMQIKLNDGTTRLYANAKSLWTKIFHSRLFIMPRCFNCTKTINLNADIMLADPWGIETVKTDKVGTTLIFVKKECDILLDAVESGLIHISEISEVDAVASFITTVFRKKKYLQNGKRIQLLKRLIKNNYYRSAVLRVPLFFTFHNIIKKQLEK